MNELLREHHVAVMGNQFVLDGDPTFLLADTVWSSFCDPTPGEWTQYLEVRARQNFNGVQISVLPLLHDWSERRRRRAPFAVEDGRVLWDSLDERYFDHAVNMLAEARNAGFQPVLAVFWANYAPGTWLSVEAPGAVASQAVMHDLVDLMAERFAPFAPLWLVSGDTDLANQETIDFYDAALRRLRARIPDAVAGFHLQDVVGLPPQVAESPDVGFYAYQSGHRLEMQDLSYKWAEQYRQAEMPTRPIINAEPCYEGSTYGFRRDGRFGADAVRKAYWQSFLAGAQAGFTYGAHGMWGWHPEGAEYHTTAFAFEPFGWRTALAFPGPDDIAWATHLVRTHDLQSLVPRQDLIDAPDPGFRAAATPDGQTTVVYLPHAATISVAMTRPSESTLWNLAARRPERPRLEASGDTLRLRQPQFNGDALFVLKAGA